MLWNVPHVSQSFWMVFSFRTHVYFFVQIYKKNHLNTSQIKQLQKWNYKQYTQKVNKNTNKNYRHLSVNFVYYRVITAHTIGILSNSRKTTDWLDIASQFLNRFRIVHILKKNEIHNGNLFYNINLCFQGYYCCLRV